MMKLIKFQSLLYISIINANKNYSIRRPIFMGIVPKLSCKHKKIIAFNMNFTVLESEKQWPLY